jgi:hypothetical protein
VPLRVTKVDGASNGETIGRKQMRKLLALAPVLAGGIFAEGAAAQTYTCPRPTGWTAFTDKHCSGRDCPPTTKWGPDQLLRQSYRLSISATTFTLSATSGDSSRIPPFVHELPITWRDEHRVTALSVTENGAQLFQFFFASSTLHWDSHYPKFVREVPIELQAFATICEQDSN